MISENVGAFQSHKTKRGNVLFLILIAVALFAALSYAVSKSSTSDNSNTVSKKKANLLASRIIQYGSSVSTAISRVKMLNGCRDTQISFENNIVSGYTNPNSPSDNRCHIFHPDGGGVVFQEIYPGSIIDHWPSAPPAFVTGCGTSCYYAPGFGSSEHDIFMIMTGHPGYPIQHAAFDEVCRQVNKIATGVETPSFYFNSSFYHGAINTKFVGSFPDATAPLGLASLGNYSAFCTGAGGAEWKRIIIPVLIR